MSAFFLQDSRKYALKSEVDTNILKAKLAIIDDLILNRKVLIPRANFTESIPDPDAGAIVYDESTGFVYGADGSSWNNLTNPAGADSVKTFSFIKNGDLSSIPANTPTIISSWDIVDAEVYHTITNWDLTTGVYTAPSVNTVLSLNVDISWKGGISNLGKRILRVKWYDASVDTTYIVKESVTQADPNAKVATTQEISFSLKLNTNDEVAIEVEHTSPVKLAIEDGSSTHISGIELI